MYHGHDAHFLQRIDRLATEYAEFALGLYQNPSLVRYLLEQLELGDSADSVALALSDERLGPYVVVARDGHFITCLAEGMQPRAGDVIVPRHRIDRMNQRSSQLQGLCADVRTGKRRALEGMLARLLHSGDSLTREQFVAIERWAPLLSLHFTLLLANLGAQVHERQRRLAARPQLGHRFDEELMLHWRQHWAIAHLTSLLGADNGEHLIRVLRNSLNEEASVMARLTTVSLIGGVTSVMPMAIRSAWLASKLPHTLYGALRARYEAGAQLGLSVLHGGALSALGQRHQRYRGPVSRTLSHGSQRACLSAVAQAAHRELAEGYRLGIHEPSQCHVHLAARAQETFKKLHAGSHWTQSIRTRHTELPDDLAIALLHASPEPVFGASERIKHYVQWLPWAAKARAEQFYLPESHIDLIRSSAPQQAVSFIRARQLVDDSPVIPAPQPVLVAPKPSRNESCPCGSRRKFKRCCGVAATRVPTIDWHARYGVTS